MKILDVNDMLMAAHETKMPSAGFLQRSLEEVATRLAAELAEHLGIESGPAVYECMFGGLCATFSPKTEGQECPVMIDQGDPAGDWEVVEEKENQ